MKSNEIIDLMGFIAKYGVVTRKELLASLKPMDEAMLDDMIAFLASDGNRHVTVHSHGGEDYIMITTNALQWLLYFRK